MLYLSHLWTEFDENLYAEIFLPTWKAYQFSSNLKFIFMAFYSSMSPLHPLLRHNVPNVTNPMEIANCDLTTPLHRWLKMKPADHIGCCIAVSTKKLSRHSGFFLFRRRLLFCTSIPRCMSAAAVYFLDCFSRSLKYSLLLTPAKYPPVCSWK